MSAVNICSANSQLSMPDVTVITSSPSKVDSCKEMGADHVIVSSSEESLKEAEKSLVSSLFTPALPFKCSPPLLPYVPIMD